MTKTGLTRGALAALLIAGASGVAAAGECPANKVKDGALTSGETMPKNVTDEVIASIDLAPKGGAFKGMVLRMRKLTVGPGGIVPWHDHATRAANIYVVSGAITEYRSTCLVPIVHKAGEVTAEFGENLAHWWKNHTRKQAVLISSDIVPAASPDDHMM